MKSIEINDVTISYTVIGKGKPIVFVHGNGEDHSIFDKTAALLKDSYTCYLLDSRGHGRSSKVSEFHYRDMAGDAIVFLEKMNLHDVVFVGFSDGGIIGLMAAAKTDRISTLIACGANMRPEGLKPFFRVSMRAAHFFGRNPLLRLMLKEPNIAEGELHRIKADTLIIAGERDLIKRSETDRIAKAIPHAEELILPGETHTSYVVHSEKLGRIIQRVLRNE